MTVTITKTETVATGPIETREFKEGEVLNLHPDLEKRLVELGIATEGGDADEAKPVSADSVRNAEANYTPNHPPAVDPAAVTAQGVAEAGTKIADGHPASLEDASTATGQTPDKADDGSKVIPTDEELKAKAEAEEKAAAEAAEAEAKAKAEAEKAAKAADKPKAGKK